MLPQIVYVAVHCKFCLRTSALSLNRDELAKKLADREPIELFCAYDQRPVAYGDVTAAVLALLALCALRYELAVAIPTV
jgi:hypothetical protein